MMVIDGERNTRMFQMIAQRAALRLEVNTGMRFSNRASIAEVIRRQHGMKSKRKADLLTEFSAYIESQRIAE